MGDVDLTGVTPGLFVADLIFILLIFSMFSLAILRAFQKNKAAVIRYVVLGVISVIVFYLILTKWFV